MLPLEDRQPVRAITEQYHAEREAHRDHVIKVAHEISELLGPLSSEQIQKCRASILSVIRHHAAGTPLPVSDGLYSLEWAYKRWLRTKDEDRDAPTIDLARRHFDAFIANSGIAMLDLIRRSHLLAWRDGLKDAGYAVN